jgi:hypothetical protein
MPVAHVVIPFKLALVLDRWQSPCSFFLAGVQTEHNVHRRVAAGFGNPIACRRSTGSLLRFVGVASRSESVAFCVIPITTWILIG